MSLFRIVRATGGELYSGGQKASIPAPGHSRADRSASLLLGRSGRVVAYSFGGATPFEILDDLKARGLIDEAGYPRQSCTPLSTQPFPSDGQKRGVVEDLWKSGLPVQGTLSARYLRDFRAIRRDFASVKSLLHHPDCRVAVYRTHSRFNRPALMSRILTPTGRATAVELTYLNAKGDRDLSLKLSRKTVGAVPPGSFVQLDDPANEIVVAEGVMTALSASEFFHLPALALLGIRNLRAYRPPACVRSVVIAADRGAGGEGAASDLRDTLVALGLKVVIRLPPEQFRDFNHMAQVWCAGAKEAGREGEG